MVKIRGILKCREDVSDMMNNLGRGPKVGPSMITRQGLYIEKLARELLAGLSLLTV